MVELQGTRDTPICIYSYMLPLGPLPLLDPPRCFSSLKMASSLESGINGIRKARQVLFSHPESPGLPSGLHEGHSRTWSQSASCIWSAALGHVLGLGCPGHLPQNTHTISARLSPGRNHCSLENGELDYVQDKLPTCLCSRQSE